ncbi:MAG: DR2241 family protein, partial [Verrucomicrobiota bacterium]
MTLTDHLNSKLSEPGSFLKFGQITLRRIDGSFTATHRMDLESCPTELKQLETAEAVRDMVRFDSSGEYRPLKSAPNLKCGWIIQSECAETFLQLIDAIYPSCFAAAIHYA